MAKGARDPWPGLVTAVAYTTDTCAQALLSGFAASSLLRLSGLPARIAWNYLIVQGCHTHNSASTYGCLPMQAVGMPCRARPRFSLQSKREVVKT